MDRRRFIRALAWTCGWLSIAFSGALVHAMPAARPARVRSETRRVSPPAGYVRLKVLETWLRQQRHLSIGRLEESFLFLQPKAKGMRKGKMEPIVAPFGGRSQRYVPENWAACYLHFRLNDDPEVLRLWSELEASIREPLIREVQKERANAAWMAIAEHWEGLAADQRAPWIAEAEALAREPLGRASGAQGARELAQ